MTILYDPDGIAGKICNKCGEWKPVSEFHHHSKARDGYKIDAKKRRDANIEYHRAIGRKAYANNIEKRRTYNRMYHKTHRERMREQVRIRRNRKYQAEGFHTEAEWAMLKASYNYTCLCCGQREPEITLTRDHIIPLTQGGSDWITNIQPLCYICNSSKNNKSIDYRPNWTPISEPSSETSAAQ